MKATSIFLLAVAITTVLAGCSGVNTSYVDDEAAKIRAKQQDGPKETCAVCGNQFPEGSLKDYNGKRMCGTCIDAAQG